MSMSNMRRRQKLILEQTVGRLNNLDRGIKDVKLRTELHKLKETMEMYRS